jgi:hypothetical protein
MEVGMIFKENGVGIGKRGNKTRMIMADIQEKTNKVQ